MVFLSVSPCVMHRRVLILDDSSDDETQLVAEQRSLSPAAAVQEVEPVAKNAEVCEAGGAGSPP